MGYSENSIFENLMAYNRNGRDEKLKKLKPSERLLEEIKGFGFNMSQLETVLKQKGNQLILSCAGSGKTTALIFKVIYDQKTGWATRIQEVNGNTIRIPEKIWVCTFLKSGADELKASLIKWQRRLHCVDTSQSIAFSTLHAEFKRALNSMSISTNIISESDNSKCLREVLKAYALKNADGRPLNADNIRDLMGALTYTRNRLDSQRYTNEVYDELNIGSSIIDAILRDWKAERRKAGYWDFEDLQEKLYEECYVRNNQDVINYLSGRYNFIYIDEFQDTSQIQYALLKVYAGSAKQIVAIGDDDQTIYSWRGSYNGIITKEFLNDFSPVKNDLSINFRCPSNVLKAIKPSIEKNTKRFKKDLRSSKEGGVVRYGGYLNYKRMVTSLSEMVYEDVKNGKNVAILCRVNSDGLMPALILDKLNTISFSISGDGMTLDSYIGRTVMGIIRLFTERSTLAVKNALNLLTYDQYCVNNLMKVCKINKASIWDIRKEDLTYSCPSIADRLLNWRKWRESEGEIGALRLVLEDYRVNIFQKDTQFNEVVKSVISSIETLLDYYDYKYVEDFLVELEDINERLKARKKKVGTQVRIATVHEFKGKEADSVYIWNDSEDVYPYRGSDEDVDNYEEERRIHYIACTRAREVSTVMYLKTRPGDFVREMDFSDAVCLTKKAEDGGVMVKLGERMKEDGNLRKFEEVCTSKEEENPFWDVEQEFENRYAGAEDDFQRRMRRR